MPEYRCELDISALAVQVLEVWGDIKKCYVDRACSTCR